jgi:hypothetical protein
MEGVWYFINLHHPLNEMGYGSGEHPGLDRILSRDNPNESTPRFAVSVSSHRCQLMNAGKHFQSSV